MGRVAAIGADLAVRGFGLAGALILPAEDEDGARAAWRTLPADVEVVILTPEAARAIGPVSHPLTVVVPR